MQTKNIITSEVLWSGTPATPQEVDSAVKKAVATLPSWSKAGIEFRKTCLEKFKTVLQNNKDTFAELISKEMGKVRWESLAEVSAMIAKIDISIEAQAERCPTRQTQLPFGSSITRHKPLGVLAVFGPFNFPGHLPNGHIVPALLAGNTIVFKPSELTPAVGEAMVKLWQESGLPEGVINLVQGGISTGQALAAHDQINGLLFTGSWNTGKILAEQFGHHPDKLLALEMGGNNPLVLDEVSEIDPAVYTIIQSAYATSGQRCTCARRLIVVNSRQNDRIIDALIASIPKITVGHYTDNPEPFMGPVINQDAAQKLLAFQDSLLKSGGKCLVEMKRLNENTPLISPGLIDVTATASRDDCEHFGPLLQIIRVDSLEEAIKEANNTKYGLSSGILTDKKEHYIRFYDEIKAGLINWNTPLTGASSSAPFGGLGHSGNYRPSAYYAADYCNYPVASIENELVGMPKTMSQGLQNVFT